MKPERTIQYCYDHFPKLFPTRQRVLDHLFCVVGNGYSWYKGEVVSDEDLYIWNEDVERFVVDRDFHVDEEPDIISKSPLTDEEYEKELDEWHMSMANLKHLAHPEVSLEELYEETKKNFHKWYPMSKEFPLIYNVPEDVTPEWKSVVEECKAMLKADGIEIQ